MEGITRASGSRQNDFSTISILSHNCIQQVGAFIMYFYDLWLGSGQFKLIPLDHGPLVNLSEIELYDPHKKGYLFPSVSTLWVFSSTP